MITDYLLQCPGAVTFHRYVSYRLPHRLPYQFTLSFTIYGLPGYIRKYPIEIEANREGRGSPLDSYEKCKKHFISEYQKMILIYINLAIQYEPASVSNYSKGIRCVTSFASVEQKTIMSLSHFTVSLLIIGGKTVVLFC